MTGARSTSAPSAVRMANSWSHTGLSIPAGAISKGTSLTTWKPMCSSMGSTSESVTGSPQW